MHRLRPLVLALLVLVCAGLSVTGAGVSLASFTDTAPVGGNTLTSSWWTYYLHNNPTPPTRNTTFQADLTATPTASIQATLFNYDRVDCDSRTGRLLVQVAAPTPGNTTVCEYVNWRLPVQTAALPLTGSVTADVWSATQTNQGPRTGSIIAYLRDYDPVGMTYQEIANATYTGSYAAGRTFYERPITISITGTYTVAIGHQLELKLECPDATSAFDMMVAYDTTGYPSFLRLP
jgi:hypothetical protein